MTHGLDRVKNIFVKESYFFDIKEICIILNSPLGGWKDPLTVSPLPTSEFIVLGNIISIEDGADNKDIIFVHTPDRVQFITRLPT